MEERTRTGEIVLVRHGETEWSRTGQHTGRSDIPLTPYGEDHAASLRADLDRPFAVVLSSPLARARRTAELAGFAHATNTDDLLEWDYGDVDGVTHDDYVMRREAAGLGDWNLWTDGAPGGESPDDVAARADRVIAQVLPTLTGEAGARGDVLLFAHGHLLCVLAARWLSRPASAGQDVVLDAGHRGVLGLKRGHRIIRHWNLPPAA